MLPDPGPLPHADDTSKRGRFPAHEDARADSQPSPRQMDELDPILVEVLESAARLQELIPDAVLVGGSAAALYAGHRRSYDHDHVIQDLRDRFELVLDALEREPDWVMNRVTPGKIILGELGEIEAGVRQLIRTVPLETVEILLPSGRSLRVPTQEETVRIKAFLIVKRNQVRDYLDVAALSARYGTGTTARQLSQIDRYYSDSTKDGTPVADQLVRQLADPRPKDSRTTARLADYKALDSRWHDWNAVREELARLADRIVARDWED